MEAVKDIESFLDRVRRKRAGFHALNGFYSTMAVLTGGYLAGNLFVYFSTRPRAYLPAFLFLVSAILSYVFWRHFIRGVFSPFSRDRAALLVEAKFPALNNSLINSWQLQDCLTRPEMDRGISFAFIRELVRETALSVQEISPDAVIDRTEAVRNRNRALAAVGLLLIIAATLPDFLTRGYANLFSGPKRSAVLAEQTAGGEKAGPAPAAPLVFSVKDLTLVFNYPAYTRLKSSVVSNADGQINVLPGTEARVKARIDKPVGGGNLVLNGKDSLAMSLTGETEIAGQMLIKEEGYYQLEIKSADGRSAVLPAKYPIALAKDLPPRIILFTSNPKPVYYPTDKVQLLYDSADDYGLQKIELVADVDGKTARIPIKSVKDGTKELKDSYTWSLAELGVVSGERVKYYLEAQDNDNIFGPNTGHSEVYSFSIYDLQGERENLVQLQDELIEKMIDLLAQGLVGGDQRFKQGPPNAQKLKAFMTSSADQTIEIVNLAQRILDQAKTVPSFPQSYLVLMKNIVSDLTRVRAEQIESIGKITASLVQSTPIGYDFPPFEEVNDKLVAHLEKAILFLIKINNRQKMDQAMDMKRSLSDLAELLKKEFEKAKQGKKPLNIPDFKKQIEKIKQTMKKMMDQLARQTQALPDEFLNPNSFKSLDFEKFEATLEKIMDMVGKNDLDQAIKEMEKLSDDLKTLSNQLDQAEASMDKLVDLEIMKKIDDSLRDLLKLEKEQTQLLEQTGKINQSLRESQAGIFEDRLKKFFESLKSDVNQAQNILKGNGQFLENHGTLKKFAELLDRENRENQDIKDLEQKTIDSLQSSNLDSNFVKLNQARAKRSQTLEEIEALRAGVVQRFKNFLPQFSEKYDALEELAELSDLPEFNSQFKNVYPETLRWMNNLSMAPDTRPDLADRLNGDLREINRINGEISKKLGTTLRELEKNFRDLLTQQNKEEMERIAKKQSQMEKTSGELAQRFAKMNQQNPMINPELSLKMTGAGKHMEKAESYLRKHDLPRSIESENSALQELTETREMLNELKNANDSESQKGEKETSLKLGSGRARDQSQGGSIRMQKERVNLPSEDQFQAPREFREEILKAMKNKYPRKYERFVTEYYKELVK
ncbi:MAG: DUF4175 family protein [Nitrospinae bacterium]|nr:DUF4175 family protein [Nitrospinota bacterium]